jgi:hypothetical protein
MKDDVVGSLECELRVINVVGFWMEASLYGTSKFVSLERAKRCVSGLYLGLCVVACNPLLLRRSPEGFAAKVFLAGNLVLFVLIGIHYGTLGKLVSFVSLSDHSLEVLMRIA